MANSLKNKMAMMAMDDSLTMFNLLNYIWWLWNKTLILCTNLDGKMDRSMAKFTTNNFHGKSKRSELQEMNQKPSTPHLKEHHPIIFLFQAPTSENLNLPQK